MIQEAHIGIGISGLEGQQAVNASDFSIAQFRFLEPLLLVHGRWNYMRMSKAVLFFFYKNLLLVGTMICFSQECLHSGTSLYDMWVVSVFNFVGASMPVVMMAVFDRDIPKDYVLRNSQVYQSGPNQEFLSARVLFRWVLLTFLHTVAIYLPSASGEFDSPSLLWYFVKDAPYAIILELGLRCALIPVLTLLLLPQSPIPWWWRHVYIQRTDGKLGQGYTW